MTDNTSTAIVLTREELKEMSKNFKELKENTQYTYRLVSVTNLMHNSFIL